MIAKKKHLDKQYATQFKTNKKCFNCRIKNYYTKNCYFLHKKKPEKSAKKTKYTWEKKNQANKAAAAKSKIDHNNSNAKFYPTSRAFINCAVSADRKQLKEWYFNLYISKHICNNQ